MAACASPPPVPPAPPTPPPAAFRHVDPNWTRVAPAEAQPRGEWWRAFGEPALDALVVRASGAAPEVLLARARVAQARAAARAADAARAPTLGLQAGASRQGGPLVNRAGESGTLLDLGAVAAYELDLGGRLSAGARAAALDLRAREALLQSARLAVQAEVASTWGALRAADAERALVRDTLRAWRASLALLEQRLAAGSVAELDVVRMRAEVETVRAELAAVDRARNELEHALAALCGESASSFAVAEYAWDARPPVVPPGVPSTVLARRPDVAAAQAAVMAAQARVGAAEAAWFPSLSLTAAGGVASSELGELLRASARAWGLGALLALPILDGGRREAGVAAARADVELALAEYHGRILVAFREVEDRLAAIDRLDAQADAQRAAIEATRRAGALAASRYRSGLGTQLEVLDAERGALRLQRGALQVRAARWQASVGLVRALGGGWDTAPASVAPAAVVPAPTAGATGARPETGAQSPSSAAISASSRATLAASAAPADW